MDNRWTRGGAAISLDIPLGAQCGGRKGFGSGLVELILGNFSNQIPCARGKIVNRPGAAGAVLQTVL